MLPLILEKVDIDAIAINNEMDGNFPAHEPNPLKEENLAQLKKTIRKENADFGVCFDGDADRLGVVSGKGDTIRNDFLTAMIAKRLLKEQKNETILYDLRSSKVVGEEIEKAGGRGVMCRVGHAFIKKQMREANGIFAGELSGHYYYRDNFFCRQRTDNLHVPFEHGHRSNPFKKILGKWRSECKDPEQRCI
jgi:phosphomannomutase (EC 5.4.2.8)